MPKKLVIDFDPNGHEYVVSEGVKHALKLTSFGWVCCQDVEGGFCFFKRPSECTRAVRDMLKRGDST